MSDTLPLTKSLAADIEAMARKPVVLDEGLGSCLIAVPEPYVIEQHNEHLPYPPRARGTVTMHDVASFIVLVNRHANPEHALIYVDADYKNGLIYAVAVFNDHTPGGQPGWCDHRARFSPIRTEEWDRWKGADGKANAMSQDDFAFFLEANADDIIEPDGSEVLTFVLTLSDTRKVRYGSAINLTNGMMQIEFTEEGDNATKGKLELFKEFTLAIRPLRGTDPYRIKARLRYRIERNSGAISFWFELHRPDRILEDAARKLVERIAGETQVTVLAGNP